LDYDILSFEGVTKKVPLKINRLEEKYYERKTGEKRTG
jgi:hypothetical protein